MLVFDILDRPSFIVDISSLHANCIDATAEAILLLLVIMRSLLLLRWL